MAGRKFGTGADACRTWALNAWLPSITAERYRGAAVVAFSSGNIYPLVDLSTGGSRECDPVGPIGEYPMSVLARERVFEYAASEYGTRVLLFRLSYAIDLRYGVLFDIASKVLHGQPVSLSATCFNCVWQGYANEAAIRSLTLADAPAQYLNVTGPEILSVRATALAFGEIFGREVTFTGEEAPSAYISNSQKACALLGYPSVTAGQLIRWQAEYLLCGGRTLDKPTHFEERKGSY
jgi:nucleoside-diphosphate-sugar epimerase